MKFLIVKSDGDFGAVYFENKWGGTPIKDVIENQSKFLPTDEEIEEGEEWYFEIKEFKFVSLTHEFMEYLGGFIDYDFQKNSRMYAEFETV